MNIGDKAPEILGKDEQGRDIRLSDYQGRKLYQPGKSAEPKYAKEKL